MCAGPALAIGKAETGSSSWRRHASISGNSGISAPPGNTCRLLARDHAAPEPTLLLTKAAQPCLVGVRTLAWCSQPRIPAASPGGALMRVVVALGGNALLRRGEPLTAENQRANAQV